MADGFFSYQNSSGRLYINKNNQSLIVSRKNNLLTVPSMVIGGHGDPHLYIRKGIKSLSSSNYLSGNFLAQWGDNKAGTSGNSEILFFHLETVKDTIKIFYTNKIYTPNGAKLINSIRVEFNGTTTTYNNSAYIKLGPVVFSIIRLVANGINYLAFEMFFPDITNAKIMDGAISLVFKRIASTNGYWNGGDGASWDGYSYAGQPYSLNRSSYQT
jgi:hypothetical protein